MGTLAKLAWFVWSVVPAPSPAYSGEVVLYRVNQIRVLRRAEPSPPDGKVTPYTYLMRGDTHRGLNYESKDLRRLATTYHHRRSPVGMVMEQFAWFHAADRDGNGGHSDARMPVSIIGYGPDPWRQLVNLWSEPPYGVVGMYVGGMASYARPFQYVDFYESDPNIIKLSLPGKGGRRYFNYIHDARRRMALVRVFQGEERRTLSRRAPQHFYHVLVLEICPRDRLEDLSVNLLTKEGMALCFERLTDEGILCVHVSNRYLKVVPVLADVAQSLGFATMRGRDLNVEPTNGAFTSDWVMVARNADTLNRRLKVPEGYDVSRYGLFWKVPAATGRHVWTDRGWNSVRGLMYYDPGVNRMERALGDAVFRWATRMGLGSKMRFSSYGSLEVFSRFMIGLRERINQRVESLGDRPSPPPAPPRRPRPARPGRAPAGPGA